MRCSIWSYSKKHMKDTAAIDTGGNKTYEQLADALFFRSIYFLSYKNPEISLRVFAVGTRTHGLLT